MLFEDWEKLVFGTSRGECILFLGPELPLVQPHGVRRLPAEVLARSLLATIEADETVGSGAASDRLARAAKLILSQQDELDLEMAVGKWRERLEGQTSLLHEDLAALPFHRIVTSGFDPLIENALRAAGKDPAVEWYSYRGARRDLLPEPTEKRPLVFYLYGHPRDWPSVVLTETQLLEFLTALISKNPPLPNDLNDALSNGRLFLFLGFGLDHWHLRALLHVLKVLRPSAPSRSFAFEAPDGDGGGAMADAVLFYRDFKFDIYRQDVAEFAAELRRRFEESAPARAPGVDTGPMSTLPQAEAPTVFLCHASEDKARAREVQTALEAAGLRPWLDAAELRGGDRWDDVIEETIGSVDYFVVLHSRWLVAKSRRTHYVNKEIRVALKVEREYRLEGAFIVPALVDDEPLLKTLSDYQAVDLGADNGLLKLVRAIKRHAAAIR